MDARNVELLQTKLDGICNSVVALETHLTNLQSSLDTLAINQRVFQSLVRFEIRHLKASPLDEISKTPPTRPVPTTTIHSTSAAFSQFPGVDGDQNDEDMGDDDPSDEDGKPSEYDIPQSAQVPYTEEFVKETNGWAFHDSSATKDYTKYPKSPRKARHLVRFLTKTNMPPSLALKLVNGLRKHIFSTIGGESQYGSSREINKEEFEKRRQRLIASQKECSFTAVGDLGSSQILKKFVMELVSFCFALGYHPAYIRRKVGFTKPDVFEPFRTKLSKGELENPDNWHYNGMLNNSWSMSLPIREDIAKRLEGYI